MATAHSSTAQSATSHSATSYPVTPYLDYTGLGDVLSGGARSSQSRLREVVIGSGRSGRGRPPPQGAAVAWWPGVDDQYLEACDSYLPAAGVEYYYYDQLGSGFSDQPEEPSLWELDRYVDEVEQVRRALGLDRENLVLYGHSWGGLLAVEYALHHQEHLKGLVISNMMSSVPAYDAYAHNTLMKQIDPRALKEIKALEESGDVDNPRYMQLLNEHHNVHHVLRMPVQDWPDPVVRAFAHINPDIYIPMQGPSELGVGTDAKLASWDRTNELASIRVPALVIGARYDTMDPAYMEMMASRLPAGQYLYCPNGSHLAMYDDQVVYFDGLVKFLREMGAP